MIAQDPSAFPPVGDDFIRRSGTTTHFDWYFPQSTGVFRLSEDGILNVVTFSRREETVWEVYRGNGLRTTRDTVDRAFFPMAAWSAGEGEFIVRRTNQATGEAVLGLLKVVIARDE